ncbi:hypothetical protein IEQ34_011806 [Dendrobium chrysotoxum]|uniref:Uncharacterized protein n=1 Tax=Dendrobium chrysotoxum TaxID=161865 RepID=A0AAV7GS76_DENCH|nr:hypothetical protein IEQ34_011806 [Dendrobium chrysotoxum]
MAVKCLLISFGPPPRLATLVFIYEEVSAIFMLYSRQLGYDVEDNATLFIIFLCKRKYGIQILLQEFSLDFSLLNHHATTLIVAYNIKIKLCIKCLVRNEKVDDFPELIEGVEYHRNIKKFSFNLYSLLDYVFLALGIVSVSVEKFLYFSHFVVMNTLFDLLILNNLQSLIFALMMNIYIVGKTGAYRTVKNPQTIHIHPSSILAQKVILRSNKKADKRSLNLLLMSYHQSSLPQPWLTAPATMCILTNV